MYGKIFDSMYEGTLYGHWEAIVTLQQMIVLCGPDGVIDMTPQAIAARTSIPLDIITKGIKTLAEPDPYTRTPGEDGRRIVLIDDHRPWGWLIVNHQKYKNLQDAETVRAQTRERVRKHRERQRTVTDGNAQKRHTDSDTDADSKNKGKGAPRPPTRRPGWDYTPPSDVVEWVKQQGHEAYLQLHVEKFRDTCATQARKPYTVDGLDAAFRNCVRDDWGNVRRQAKDAERRGERVTGNGQWWKSDDGIKGKAIELHIVKSSDEPWVRFKARVFVAAGDGPWIDERDGTTYRLVNEIRAEDARA